MNRAVAIISQNTLEALGIKHLLESSFSASAHIYASISEIPEAGSGIYDFYFCDAINFVENLDYFLPKKQKVIIITDKSSFSQNIQHICSNHNESLLIDSLNELFAESQAKPTDSPTELSQRETDVLRLIASGMINKEIAENLGISINTVLTHRKNLTAKLGIHSVSGLSFYAMMNGIIAPK